MEEFSECDICIMKRWILFTCIAWIGCIHRADPEIIMNATLLLKIGIN